MVVMNSGGLMLLLFLVIWKAVTGHRFLGGFIGSKNGRDEYVFAGGWNMLKCWAEPASTQPQLAYVALTRSLWHE